MDKAKRDEILKRQANLSPEEKKKAERQVGAFILFIAFIIFLFWVWPSDKPKEIKTPQQQMHEHYKKYEAMAYVTSQEFIKQKLNFPEEAKFDWTPTISQFNDSGLYHIEGNVMAKNAFGVKSKIPFDCYLKYNGGDEYRTSNWELVALDMDNQ